MEKKEEIDRCVTKDRNNVCVCVCVCVYVSINVCIYIFFVCVYKSVYIIVCECLRAWIYKCEGDC
jgi:hypothetical protein